MVFTGDEFADGGDFIRKTLDVKNAKASFFLTGNFYRNRNFRRLIEGLKRDNHYLGPHSDKHLLYCDWKKRDSLLVTKSEFERDLTANYRELAHFGVTKNAARFLLPPYEWYNETIADWTKALGLSLINFTSGTRSNADYTYPEMGKSYKSSVEIFKSIVEYDKTSPNKLNGFILLMHIGTDPRRKDKFYMHLPNLIDYLKQSGYELVRIDQLLKR